MQGLTRLLVACPEAFESFLPDFLEVNDAYILEGVLLAVLGGVLDGAKPEMAANAAMRVYESQFPEGNPRWCHVTIRHYARCIVEAARCPSPVSRINRDSKLSTHHEAMAG